MARTSLNEVQGQIIGRRVLEYKNSDPTTPILDSSSQPIHGSVSRYRATVNTPNFRTIRREDLPMNPFTFRSTVEIRPHGTYAWSQHDPAGNHGFQVGAFVGNVDYNFNAPLPSSYDQSSIDAAARNGHLKALKSQQVNFGIAAAEWRQTKTLYQDAFKRVSGAADVLAKDRTYRGFRRAADILGYSVRKVELAYYKRRKGRTSDQQLANDWLALQFGWLPHLNDVYGAAEALARHQEGNRWTRLSTTRTYRRTIKDMEGGLWFTFPTARTGYVIYLVKYVSMFRVQSGAVKTLSEVGLTNPATVLYELTPWSFALDWFIPIGQWIDTWDATNGLQFVKGCKTTVTKTAVIIKCRATGKGFYDSASVHGSASKRTVDVVRVQTSDFPSPALPRFKEENPLDLRKSLISLALLRQRIGKAWGTIPSAGRTS